MPPKCPEPAQTTPTRGLRRALRPLRRAVHSLRPPLRALALTAAAAAAVAVTATVSAQGPAPSGQDLSASTSNPVVSWTSPTVGSSPPPLAYASAAYDADNSTVVLFGGVTADGRLSSSTWIWNGTAWSQPRTTQPPPARELASMAFDPALHQLILFGGQGAGGTLLADTWAWNGVTWVQVAAGAAAPAGREAAAFAYDASGGLLLFGGTGLSSAGSTTPGGSNPTNPSTPSTTVPTGIGGAAPGPLAEAVLGDTWEWTSSGWARVASDGPPARSGGVMAYDRSGGVTVMFGGEATPAASGVARPLADTWVWAGSRWWSARPAASPSARFGAVADDFASLGGPLLTGGQGSGGDQADAFVWNGATWVQAWLEGSPAPRAGAAGAYDAAAREMVVFGGVGDGGATLGDTGLIRVVPVTSPTSTTVGPAPGTTGAATTTAPTGPHPTTTPTTRAVTPTSTTTRPAGPTTVAPSTPPLPVTSLQVYADRAPIRQGSTVRVVGTGFAPGSVIELTFHSVPVHLGSAIADPSGRFSTVVAVPRRATTGSHRIVATGTTAAGTVAQPAYALTVGAPKTRRTSAFTTVSLLALALLFPVTAYLAMVGAGVWRRRRSPG